MSMRRNGIRMGAWGAVAVVCACAAAVGGEIRIWPSCVVQGEAIHLGDVADVGGFAAGDREKLRDIIVSAAPKAGGDLTVQTSDVRSALAEAHVNLADISLVGSSRCKVSRMHPTVATLDKSSAPRHVRKISMGEAARPQEIAARPTTATLESVLRDYIAARVGDTEGKVEVRFSPTCRSALQLAAARHHFDIRPREQTKLGLLTLEVQITGDDVAPKQVPVVAEVSLTREVVVAKRPINRGETIEGRNLKLEQRRFTDYSQIGVTDLAAVTGQQARQLIRPGEMLLDRILESKPVVRRGDPVTIWMRQGGLVIKASGRAQASGSLGERIEVAREGTKRKQDLIEAIVTGPATVTVGEGQQVALAEGK